jgi:Cdc6-like AAA superfamily ATPase
MDIDALIRRRQRVQASGGLVVDYDFLSPVSHVEEPVARCALVEKLLDHLKPAFDGAMPPNGSLHGPKGSGKSAVVSVLFDRLASASSQADGIIHISTRVEETTMPTFVYIDGREANTRFTLYQNLLDGLVEESVPAQGVGTDWMSKRLRAALEAEDPGAVVAVDHLSESATKDAAWVFETCDSLANVSWLTIGRDPPKPFVGIDDSSTFDVDRYQDHVLHDILTTRVSEALRGKSLDRGRIKSVARWADGDAHDALAALLSATDLAIENGETALSASEVENGIKSVPRPCVSLGKIVSLPQNRRAVLRALVELDDGERTSVTTAAEAISAKSELSVSADTVRRFLYQLADSGILERIPHGKTSGKGRPPSRVEFRFPARAFKRLYDAQS